MSPHRRLFGAPRHRRFGYMIRIIKGKIIGKTPPQLIVEVNGIGYGVFLPLDSFDRVQMNQDAIIFTHHHVSEGKQELYGFLDTDQRDFFELLLTVSGVGPKSALSIIGSNQIQVLRSAIAEGQAQIFANASGIGKKTAERIIVDLKSKVGMQPDIASGYGDTYEVLRALGYTAAEVKKALQA